MDRFAVCRRQTYFELFKACRLCGSGGGYKMPIVQAAQQAERGEPELREKIKDCCSIDVRQDDKMPPLICELCVDKVNDFFEFREMCKSTNVRVRASLGLPAQTFNQDTSEDCILGVSGPLIYESKEMETSQPLARKPIKIKVSLKDLKKDSKTTSREVATPSPSDKRSTRKETAKANSESFLSERQTGSKRKRGSDQPLSTYKKIKFTDLTPKFGNSTSSKKTEKRETASDVNKKTKEPTSKKAASANVCDVCKATFTKPFALRQHLTTQHTVNTLPIKFGCAPCREWFTSAKLVEEHHKWHRLSSTYYRCDRCSAGFKVLQGYTKHFALKQCIPEVEVPDVVCSTCQRSYATENLKNNHVCAGSPSIEEMCSKCKKHIGKRAKLKKHESSCKGLTTVSPEVNPNNPHLKALKPIHITMPKCDTLLEKIKREPIEDIDIGPIYDISRLSGDDAITIKSEPPEYNYDGANCDMDIKHEIKEEYPDYMSDCGGGFDDYSNDSGSEAEASHAPNLVINPFARKNTTQVESLSFISLRSIFSNKMFKRKNKNRKRTLKVEKTVDSTFDSLFGDSAEPPVIHKQEVEELQGESIVNHDFAAIENDLQENIAMEVSHVMDLNIQKDDLSSVTGDENNVSGDNVTAMDVDENPSLLHVNNDGCNQNEIETQNIPNDNCIQSEIETHNTPKEDCIQSEVETQNIPSEDSIQSEVETQNKPKEDCIQSEVKTQNTPNDDCVQKEIENQNIPNDNKNTSVEDSVIKNDVTAMDVDDDPSLDINNGNCVQNDIESQNTPVENNVENEKIMNEDNILNQVSVITSMEQNSIEIENVANVLSEREKQDNIDGNDDNLFSNTESYSNTLENYTNAILTNSNDKKDLNDSDNISNLILSLDKNIRNDENEEKKVVEENSNLDSHVQTLYRTEISESDNLLTDKLVEEMDVHCSNTDKIEEPRIDLPKSNIQYAPSNENLSNLIDKSSEHADIDFDIDSIFQGQLGPLAMKKQTEIIINKNIFDKAKGIESAEKESVISIISNTNSNNFDSINDLAHLCKDQVYNENFLNTSVTDSKESTSEQHKLEQETNVEKSESDILDLVSDSGDDCNIIDSPEKLKALEDQLMADDVDDLKINQIEMLATKITENNDEYADVQNSSVYKNAADEFEINNFDRQNELSSNAIVLSSNTNNIELDKSNSCISVSTSLESDKLLSNIDKDQLGVDLDLEKFENVVENDDASNKI